MKFKQTDTVVGYFMQIAVLEIITTNSFLCSRGAFKNLKALLLKDYQHKTYFQ